MIVDSLESAFAELFLSPIRAALLAIQNYKDQVLTAEAQRVQAEKTRKDQRFRYQIEVMKHNQIMRSQ